MDNIPHASLDLPPNNCHQGIGKITIKEAIEMFNEIREQVKAQNMQSPIILDYSPSAATLIYLAYISGKDNFLLKQNHKQKPSKPKK